MKILIKRLAFKHRSFRRRRSLSVSVSTSIFEFNISTKFWHTFHECRKLSKNLRAGCGGWDERSVCHPQAEVIATNFQA